MKDPLSHDDFRALADERRTTGRKYIGLTSLEEQAYGEWIASQVDLALGGVVDLGCWLGSITRSLGLGMLRNPTFTTHPRRIQAYDYFYWNTDYDGLLPGFEAGLEPGADFRPLFREMNPEIRDFTDLHAGFLEDLGYAGEPLSLIVNDVWKQLSTARCTIQDFFPSLQVGGYLLNQDQLWCTDAFIQVIIYRLRDYLAFAYQVPNATMCVFRCIRPIPRDLDVVPAQLSDVPLEEIHAAFAWYQPLLSPYGRAMSRHGHYWMCHMAGYESAASELAEAILADPITQDPHVAWQLSALPGEAFAPYRG